MLKIYHMPGSRSTRVIWTAEELGLPYELIVKQRAELKRPDFLAINPLGNAPAIEDGDITMSESCAIVEYLVDRYDATDHLAPTRAAPDRGTYLQWLHFPEATLMPYVTTYMTASGRFTGLTRQHEAMTAAKRRVAGLIDYIDDTLAAHAYIASDRFSAADIALYWVLSIGARLEVLDMRELDHITEYMARCEERAGLAKAMLIPEGFVNQPPGSVETPVRIRG